MVNEEAVRFIYNPDQEGGILSFCYSKSQKRIRNQDVIAVLETPKASSEDGNHRRHTVLLILTAETPTKSSPPCRLESYVVENLPGRFVDLHAISLPPHMKIRHHQDGSSNLHVVISIGSGLGKAQEFYDNILKPLLQCILLDEFSFQLHVTESENSIIDLTREVLLPRANEGYAQTVVLLSGDGGVLILSTSCMPLDTQSVM